jgi:LmbE family N-acetylglucosaminyl deacetylase
MAAGLFPLEKFQFFDLSAQQSVDISDFFPDWGSSEVVVVFSPHDDDSILGAGYAMMAAAAAGAEVFVVIFNDGSAGFSDPALADTIVATRRQETTRALEHLGVGPDHVERLEIPDFSTINYLGWVDPGRQDTPSVFERVVKFLRKVRCTRLFLPNGWREHLDHSAANQAGIFDAVQAGDAVMVTWGDPSPIKSYLMYSVWGAFSPLDEQVSRTKVIGVPAGVEQIIQDALQEWGSQQEIIADLLAQRENRFVQEKEQYIEVYLDIDPRPRFDFAPYKRKVAGI